MISCRNLTKRFGDFTALNNFSFEVQRGRICALLGPNGAGKSTLLKILTGLLHATSGEATVAGFDPAHGAIEMKRVIGVVPEDLALFDELTIEEHIQLGGPIYGLSREETRARTGQLLRVFGLESTRTTFVGQGSHGMRKKTALAMALLHNPQVVILDEPYEGIDPVTAESISARLRSMAAHGITVLFTSHILSAVNRVADQVVMIRAGHRVLASEMSELTRTLEELYFELVEAPVAEELDWLQSPQS